MHLSIAVAKTDTNSATHGESIQGFVIGGSMREQNNSQPLRSQLQPARLEMVVNNQRKAKFPRRVVGLNHSVKESVRKVFYESDFDITSLLQVARLAGIRGQKGEPQRKVREILREAFFDRDEQPPPGPAQIRRAA